MKIKIIEPYFLNKRYDARSLTPNPGPVIVATLLDQAGHQAVVESEYVSKINFDNLNEADLVGISYRLTPETGERLLAEFAEEADELHRAGVKFAFGGTPPVVQRVNKIGFFEISFDGTETTEQVLAYLKGQKTMIRQEANIFSVVSVPSNEISKKPNLLMRCTTGGVPPKANFTPLL